jgi:hypothetical protein
MAWLLNGVSQQKQQRKKDEAYRAVMQYAARLGGEMFGPVPNGTRREFFCLDPTTWVWHQEWNDQAGHHALTTRYDVRPGGILKSTATHSYQRLSREEDKRFRQAVHLYQERVGGELRRIASMA